MSHADFSRYAIAIQVRNRSTRLPGKMQRPFYQGMTIPELMAKELLRYFPASRMVVATSQDPDDTPLAGLAERLQIRCARGSEQDVLGRVFGAVRDDPAEYVVRVCGDNPFLRGQFVFDLMQLVEERSCDYASFALPDGTPTILSHLGLFTEIIRKTTLQQMAKTAWSPRHREHLTSHILDNPAAYDCVFLEIPQVLHGLSGLRLTVDTESDFAVCRQIYDLLVNTCGHDFSLAQLIEIVRARPELRAKMAEEIAANAKQ